MDLVVEGYTKLLGPEYWETIDALNQRETITKMMKDIVSNEEIEGDRSKREKFIVKWRKVRAKMKEISVERKRKMEVNK